MLGSKKERTIAILNKRNIKSGCKSYINIGKKMENMILESSAEIILLKKERRMHEL